jgi:hypothetical protein
MRAPPASAAVEIKSETCTFTLNASILTRITIQSSINSVRKTLPTTLEPVLDVRGKKHDLCKKFSVVLLEQS